MTNLTISVPEAVLARARARAVREGTSVNARLRAELERYADQDDAVAAGWAAFVDLADRLELASGNEPGPGPGGRSWRRQDLQREAIVRRR